MARAQVCRFYDDAKSGALLRRDRRSPKRLPDYDSSSTGGSYKRRTAYSKSTVNKGLIVQALAIVLLLALLVVPSLESNDVSGIFSGLGGVGGVHNRRADKVQLNVPQSEVQPGVSLVAVCMGRPDTLRKTAQAWLNVRDVDEVILVDWSSKQPLEPVVRSLPQGQRIKVIRVEGEPAWVLSRAYNLAVNASNHENIIRTDCDYRLEPNFVEAHRALMNSDKQSKAAEQMTSKDAKGRGFYYSGNYNNARNENEVHLNGAVFIRRKDFVDIGGYDERIQTYGWDDEDLYNRLGAHGLQKQNISYDHVSHVKHGDGARAQSGVKFAGVEIDLNSLLLDKLPKWSRAMRPSVYRTPRYTGSNSLVISASSRPKSLKELSNKDEYDTAWATALGRRLHDSYQVPWDIISALPNTHKELLLRRLMARLENRERLERKRLDDAGKHDEMVDDSKIPLPRLLVCHCMHGLGNRLRALASCMSFAHESNRELVVVWETDAHIEARFSDLFSSPLVVVEKMAPKWPFTDVEKWDSVWSNFKFYNYMEMEKEGAVKGAKIANEGNKHIYYKGAYIMEVFDESLTNWDKDNQNLRTLKPVPEVMERLSELESRGLGSHDVIGLHIRNRTLSKDIKNVNFVAEYGDEATSTMEKWRQASSVHSFVGEMRRIIEEKPKVKFFVATDTFQVIDMLEEKFGKDRVISMKRTCDERDGACVRYALVDMLALSKCKELYGSNWSSFTEGAERIGGLKAKLAGVDFAKA